MAIGAAEGLTWMVADLFSSLLNNKFIIKDSSLTLVQAHHLHGKASGRYQ